MENNTLQFKQKSFPIFEKQIRVTNYKGIL